jgi:hypothetical protein
MWSALILGMHRSAAARETAGMESRIDLTAAINH